jgi:hypothetical protein
MSFWLTLAIAAPNAKLAGFRFAFAGYAVRAYGFGRLRQLLCAFCVQNQCRKWVDFDSFPTPSGRSLRVAVANRVVHPRLKSSPYPFREISRRTWVAALSDRSPI